MRHPRPCVVPSRAGTSPLRITAVATAALAALLAAGVATWALSHLLLPGPKPVADGSAPVAAAAS